MVASSMSITGMSSLMGYTRLHVAHLSAVPFLTSATGVLQFGQANISSSSGSTGMSRLYDTPRLLWNNSPMLFALVAALLLAVTPLVEAGQSGRANQPPVQVPEKTAEAYNQFLRAHMLEDAGDVEGAIAAYKRALLADPSAADIPADLASLYLRESRANEAIAAAEQALKISPENRDAHRVLGTVYASMAGRAPDRQRGGQNSGTQQALARAVEHL